MNIRIGLGHDTHRLENGSAIRLGGISIPFHQALAGHSDADVLVHAIIDALLGAAALPDIGELFSDKDEKNCNRNSLEMLEEVAQLIANNNWRIVNLDTIIFAERPKIAPYKQAMREVMAAVLKIPVDDLTIKAKTGEKIGIIGRNEAISAEAVVLIEKKNSF